MSIVKVREYLKKFDKDKDIVEFDESSATVEDAAKAIGCEEADIAKTLSFLVGGNPILIVMAGDRRCDNHKYKELFHEKARMIAREDLVSLIGHEAGGVCPFGVNDGVVIYLDESLKSHEFVYPACGSCNSAIKLSIKELEELSNYKEWIDVTK